MVSLIALSGLMTFTSVKAQSSASTVLLEFFENGTTNKPMLRYGNISEPSQCYNMLYYVNKNVHTRTNQRLHCNTQSSANDRARSCRVSADGPATFIIYDSPSGSTSDDYVVITVKTAVSGYFINNLEQSFDNADVNVTFHHHNGLNGKVSSFIIY